MRDLLLDDDFVVTDAGFLRPASALESVRQEIGRLAEEAGWVAAPMTMALASDVQAQVKSLLQAHPDVRLPGLVEVIGTGGELYVKAHFDGQIVEVQL
jgi:hypothetical protein